LQSRLDGVGGVHGKNARTARNRRGRQVSSRIENGLAKELPRTTTTTTTTTSTSAAASYSSSCTAVLEFSALTSTAHQRLQQRRFCGFG
jgi:hypothetical protein